MTKKTTPRSDREVIENIIRAWESLKGGRRYSPEEIEHWLAVRMGRAIDDARQHLRPGSRAPAGVRTGGAMAQGSPDE